MMNLFIELTGLFKIYILEENTFDEFLDKFLFLFIN